MPSGSSSCGGGAEYNLLIATASTTMFFSMDMIYSLAHTHAQCASHTRALVVCMTAINYMCVRVCQT